MRTELASGAWIEHRPIQDLKGKDKRKLNALNKMTAVPDSDGHIDVAALLAQVNMFEFAADQQDAIWALLLTGWSFDLPLPQAVDGQVTNVESFGELPIDDFDEIERTFAPYQAKLMRRPNPKGTTTSSSNGSSRDAAAGSLTG